MTYSAAEVAKHKAAICEGIAKGKSLRAICEQKGKPTRETVRVWLLEDEEFSAQYARAREEQADFYADEIIEIADTDTDAAMARNRIAARQWKASKLVPKKYGDKVEQHHTGAVDLNLKLEQDAERFTRSVAGLVARGAEE